MAFNFILMLTENDFTIHDASARLEDALEAGARHIGFKDVGLPFEDLHGLAKSIRKAGGRSYLEVVSLDRESEIASARAAVDLDVDCLLGGTRAAEVTEITRDHPLRYFPFPGQISGHPSVLKGSVDDIVASARRLADLEYVHGLDLLAYRFSGDVPKLMRQVAQAVTKPIVVAGSIDSEDRIRTVAESGAQAFTVGTAAFSGAFQSGASFIDQIRTLLAITADGQALSSVPRKLALVAHNERKSHLRAWVLRHRKALAGHSLICTGGTGALVKDTCPELNVRRLQRGSKGGDQQLGALVATGELDAVIFLADPTAPHGSDVDLQALTRLAIMHDIPLALSGSAADLIVAAFLPPD